MARTMAGTTTKRRTTRHTDAKPTGDTRTMHPRPGVGGSALQAILDEMTALRLPVTVRAVSSVPPQNIPGDGAAEMVVAAGYTWGTWPPLTAASPDVMRTLASTPWVGILV